MNHLPCSVGIGPQPRQLFDRTRAGHIIEGDPRPTLLWFGGIERVVPLIGCLDPRRSFFGRETELKSVQMAHALRPP